MTLTTIHDFGKPRLARRHAFVSSPLATNHLLLITRSLYTFHDYHGIPTNTAFCIDCIGTNTTSWRTDIRAPRVSWRGDTAKGGQD